MANTIRCPYPMFFEEDGRPVEVGHVYVGVYGLNPISNPIVCYYDEAMTIPASANDIRISGGYIIYKGAPRNLYVPGDYSLLVQDKNGSTIYSRLNNTVENADFLLTVPRGTLSRSMRIPPSYNFDDILESGYYSWTNAGTSNFPVGCAAADLYGLSVMAAEDGAGIIYQRLVDFTTGPTTALYTFERQSINAGAAWSAWIATNIPGGYGTGWSTGLSTAIVFPEDPRGLVCSNAADADHDITISAGGAADSTRVIWLALTSAITKQIDASWAAGNNTGGLDTGAVAANTVYYIWIIRKDSDGSIDALFSLSVTAPTMPAGYTYKRRIMTLWTDASANIIPTKQTGDWVTFKAYINDRTFGAGVASRTAYPMTVPPNMIGIFSFRTTVSSGPVDQFGWIADAYFADSTPTMGNCDFGGYAVAIVYHFNKQILVDSNRQIFARVTATALNWGGITQGWIDDRGRIA